MTGRSGLVSSGGASVVASVASTGTGAGAAISMSSSQGTQENQPIDLAQKGGGTRPQETSSSVWKDVPLGSNMKGALLHYTTGNVTQILTTSGTTAHVVTAKPVGRAENVGVGGQTLALVSRHPTPGALNLVSGGSGPTGNVRSPHPTTMSMAASHPPAAHLTYHIPRGPAAVANMTPRSQPVATPMVRPVGQQLAPPPAMGPGPRGGVVGQRVMPVSTSGGWARTTATSVHGSKVGGTTILPPGVTATAHMAPRSTTPSPRPPQGSNSITTYHPARSPMTPGNNVRGIGTTTVRGTLTADQARGTVPKAVQISQPVIAQQKYGPASGGRGVGSGGGVAVTGTTMYSSGAPLVTTLPSVSMQSQGLHPPTPTIAVRITSAPVQTVSSAGQTSQAGSNIGAVSITTPSCNPATSVLTHHMTAGQRAQTEQHTVPLKTPVLRTPVSAHQMGKTAVQTQGLAFPSGPKVITQPAQGPPLALPQIAGITGIAKPPVSVHSVQPTHTVTTQARQGVVAANSRVSMSGSGIPVAKVHPQQAVPSPTGNTVTIQGPAPHPASTVPTAGPHVPAPSHSPRDGDTQTLHGVFLHRTPGNTVPAGGPGATVSGEKVVTTIAPYSISTNAATYYYEAGQNTAYQVGGPIIPHTLNSSHYVPTTVGAGAFRTSTGVLPQTAAAGVPDPQAAPPMKPNSSPRPTILRKRNDNDGTPLKAAKNLTSALSMPPMPSPPSPKRPDSRGNGNASSGSTTISATSSPGLQIEELETSSGGGINSGTPPNIKQEPPEDANIVAPRPLPLHSAGPPTTMDSTNTMGTNTISPVTSDALHISTNVRSQAGLTNLPTDGLSPRKKPRKQQLNSLSSVLGSCRTGNELQEARSSEDDLDHHTKKIKKEPDEDQEGSDESSEKSSHTMPIITRRPQMSLLTSYRQSWKPRHNHFTRHTEVRPKEERRLTVNEIANQRMAMQRVNGWKVMHVSGQVEDLTDLEGEVVDRLQILLTALEKRTHPRKPYKDFEKDVNRLSELVKANIQRSKIIRDQMAEAKVQMNKLFDHKGKIVDIMTKYGSKRSVRKKEKS